MYCNFLGETVALYLCRSLAFFLEDSNKENTVTSLLRVSRGPCSRRATVAGPLALVVLGFGPGPMGVTGAVYIVPSGHYWEVI